MPLLLRHKAAEVANQYINTTQSSWLGFVAPDLLLFQFAALPCHVRQSRTMASARKPVIVRKFSRDWCAGYAGAGFGQDAAELEILDLTGKVLRICWDQVKWVCYVRDFPAGDSVAPERLLHKRFTIRPRTAIGGGEPDWRGKPQADRSHRQAGGAARTVSRRAGRGVSFASAFHFRRWLGAVPPIQAGLHNSFAPAMMFASSSRCLSR